ncbi:MAG: DUF3794 domain-containing protein [Eubacteriales bacterium]|nr:DUF3794 domain-containing protein [Eubacteriales bacterium]
MSIDRTVENVSCAPKALSSVKRVRFNTTGHIGDGGEALKKILFGDADASVSVVEHVGDELSVGGSVTFTVVFTDGSDTPGRISVSGNFSEKLPAPGQGEVTIDAVTDGLACRITGPRDLALSCDVELTVRSSERTETPVLVRAEGEGLVTKTDESAILVSAADEQTDIRAQYSFEINGAPPSQILFSRAFARVTQASCEGNRLLAEGETSLFVFYATEDEYEPCATASVVFPFNAALSAPVCSGETFVSAAASAAGEPEIGFGVNADGEKRILNVSVPLRVRGTVYEKQTIRYVEDGYSVSCATETETASLLCLTGTEARSYPFSFTLSCVLGEGNGEIGKICSAMAVPVEAVCERGDGGFIVSGTMQTDQTYIALGDGGISAFSTEEAFRFTVPDELPAGAAPEVSLFIRSIGFRAPDTTSVSVCVSGTATLSALQSTELRPLTALEEGEPLPDDDAAIRICPKKADEDLWHTAKRMHVLPEELCADEKADRILVYRQIHH